MSNMDLKNSETVLLDLRREILGRIENLEKDIKRQKDPLDQDWEEQGVQKENDEVLDALDDVSRTELVQIDSALQRIKDGNYQKCSKCGKEISDARLEAIPFTSVCIQCA
ncbi:MAG: TraR/DksA C4-type zinc finger protein [Leptospira sp.]|nr:TraR/DksA C4-type zinc finger protein [Leptospira sp.]